MSRSLVVTVGAAAYVLGARPGREPYDQIGALALSPGLWTYEIFRGWSGAVFDLVAQDEVASGVAGLGGGQVLAQFSDRGGSALGG